MRILHCILVICLLLAVRAVHASSVVTASPGENPAVSSIPGATSVDQQIKQTIVPFWLDFTKTIIGSFAGATFAFMFAFWLHNRQRRRENKAAGNLAMATLARMLNDFMNYKHGVEEIRQEMLKTHPKAPPWLQLKPIHYTFSGPLRFDIKSLAFLFEKGNPAFLRDIMVAEARYHDLMSSGEMLSQLLVEAQNKLAADGFAANSTRKVYELEAILGPALVAKTNVFVEGMLRTVAEDKDIYVNATKALRAKLIEYFGESEKGIIMVMLPPDAEVAPAAEAGEANDRPSAPEG